MSDRQRRQQQQDGNNAGAWMAGAAGVAALIGGGIWYLSRGRAAPETESKHVNNSSDSSSDSDSARRPVSAVYHAPIRPEQSSSGTLSYLTGLMNRANDGSDSFTAERSGRGLRYIPPDAVITNLNSLLSDIYVRYIALRETDFELHYRIFDRIFHHLHRTMKDTDAYYARYSSTVSFAGSHYDRLRIKKPDEFDMDIVIGLPLNISDDPINPDSSDIKIEPKEAGFVELKMGTQYQRLPMRDRNDWQINKTAYRWKDDDDYLTRSKFIDWFKSVVVRALNQFDTNAGGSPVMAVDGVEYTINRTESGPAITLIIESAITDFRMDVDLVPALKFPEARWPINGHYRPIPENCERDHWLIVPKPNKEATCSLTKQRSWRIALHYQERELMHNTYNLRQTVRLMKKLRDAQGMNKIASYYIKTLFLWEVVERERDDPQFWRLSPAALFKIMVDKFHTALVRGRIDYFWNKNNNLLAGVKRTVLDLYVKKLKDLLVVLEQPNNYKLVAKFLLTPQEFEDYNRRFLHI